MKKSIDWHKQCLINRQATHASHIQNLQKLQEEVERGQAEIEFYKEQIAQAILQRKDGFDRDLFLKSRKPNAND